MKLSPRDQIIAAAVAVVVVLVAIGLLLVWPQKLELDQIQAKTNEARAAHEAAKGLLAVRVASKNRSAETDAKWLRLANLVPESPDLPTLIVELQDTAFASGVQVIGMTPSAPTASATYYTIPIAVQVIGTWSDTVDYLQRIVKLNRGLRIVESSTLRTSNLEQVARENAAIPDYSEVTVIKLEAYMIPSSAPTATPAPAPAPAAPVQ
jgi:type IV pilus assembly protein PilO